MALKDLTVEKAKVTEGQIEEIIAPYISYDPVAKEIVFLPDSATLPNKAKVLTYLVALQGWPFVTNEAVSTEATPAQIEKALHIPGGSLRPILKELKDSNFITAQGYSYHVRSVALSHIKSQIQKIISGAGSPRQSGKSKRKKGVAGESAKEVKRQPRKRASVPTGDKAQFFEQLVAGKFFEQPRKLADVKEAFHEKGHIVPSTSIPSYLLKAVRDEKLRRERKTMDGLKVWVYEKAK